MGGDGALATVTHGKWTHDAVALSVPPTPSWKKIQLYEARLLSKKAVCRDLVPGTLNANC